MSQNHEIPILHKDGSWDQVPTETNEIFIIAEKGIYRFRRVMMLNHALIEAVTKVSSGGVYFLQPQEEFITLNLPRLIPLEIVNQVVAFFGDVTDRFGTEAVLPLYYSPLIEEFMAVPPARITSLSGGGIEFEFGDTPAGYVPICRFHSHADMQAFHSGTDDADERDDGLYITIGNTGRGKIPSYSCSVVCDGSRRQLEPHEVIDGLEPVSYPAEWMVPVTEYTEEQKRIAKLRAEAHARRLEDERTQTEESRQRNVFSSQSSFFDRETEDEEGEWDALEDDDPIGEEETVDNPTEEEPKKRQPRRRSKGKKIKGGKK